MIVDSRTTRCVTGDVLEVLPTFEPEGFDCCLCDPPYGLSFMGKDWDHGVPGIPFWEAILRVLKPGAMLLAFGGTRTHHRLMCAIEDAGFKIHDCVMWVYGSGFPKSRDISKAIDKNDAVDVRLARRYRFTEWVASACNLSGIQMDKICGTNTMGRHWTDRPPGGKQPDVATREHFEKLRPHFVGPVPDWVEQMVDERTVESENFKRREVVGKHEGDMGGLGGERLGKAGENITAPATEAAKTWDGWGTGLKPAWEPIIVAMKPLDGTYAQNALTHGVAGLNVDGSRVGTEDTRSRAVRKPGTQQAGGQNHRPHHDGEPSETAHGSASGRWPANLILSHHPECVQVGMKKVKGGGGKPKRGAIFKGSGESPMWNYADADGLESVESWDCHPECPVRMLDEQSGESTSRGGIPKNLNNDRIPWVGSIGPTTGGLGDTGGASRFFYTAKASKKERNMGLKELPKQFLATMGDGIGGREHSPEQSNAWVQNNHPTVKPVALTEYLARLIRPPKRDTPRRLLVPFAGSGSEMIGAIRAGWDEVVGIEQNPQYVAIAEKRLASSLTADRCPLFPEVEQ